MIGFRSFVRSHMSRYTKEVVRDDLSTKMKPVFDIFLSFSGFSQVSFFGDERTTYLQ